VEMIFEGDGIVGRSGSMMVVLEGKVNGTVRGSGDAVVVSVVGMGVVNCGES
jgi:hypothetical protein